MKNYLNVLHYVIKEEISNKIQMEDIFYYYYYLFNNKFDFPQNKSKIIYDKKENKYWDLEDFLLFFFFFEISIWLYRPFKIKLYILWNVNGIRYVKLFLISFCTQFFITFHRTKLKGHRPFFKKYSMCLENIAYRKIFSFLFFLLFHLGIREDFCISCYGQFLCM